MDDFMDDLNELADEGDRKAAVAKTIATTAGMAPANERWAEFFDRLARRVDEHGHGPDDYSHSRAVLDEMGFAEREIAASVRYFNDDGALNDFEVLTKAADEMKAADEELAG